MKKTLLLLAIASVAILTSCDPKPPVPSAPFPIGSWQTTREYFNLTVDYARPEELKEMKERETDVYVAEPEAYRLTFKEDGTGNGSGTRPDGTGRWDFSFTWQLAEGKLTITEGGSDNGGVFYVIPTGAQNTDFGMIDSVDDIVWIDSSEAQREVVWDAEDSSVTEMVLSTSYQFVMEITRPNIRLASTHTYRYTFEKVK